MNHLWYVAQRQHESNSLMSLLDISPPAGALRGWLVGGRQ
eukprot:CAMPEP_0197467140 /NCGR_PEP_ID=MMETSP1175-20131217/65413_1 /TAXON_ID=1003142 /ORGANISM="Triceratium dubium, Strain CCMP147" /LENGTH=39 /DNA_ID= /DNA_START= /DNA_END= /DNA_ORIENTATION=